MVREGPWEENIFEGLRTGRSEPCTVLGEGHCRQGWWLELSTGGKVVLAEIGR